VGRGSYGALQDVKPGFNNPEEVLAFRLINTADSIPDEAAMTFELIARRLQEIPGISSVGMATAIPMDGSNNWNPLYVEGVTVPGEETPVSRRHKWIGAGYLETMQIPLLTGRTFTWQDIHNRIPAVLVSESLAREYWGSVEGAMGGRVAIRSEPVRWHEVIGVVADVHEDGLAQDYRVFEVYWPQVVLAQWGGDTMDSVFTWGSMGYAVRSDRVGTTGFIDEVRQAVWSVNPTFPLRGVQSMPDLMARSVARSSFTLVLLGISAGVAVILGIVGVYGVMSYAVGQRQRELGLRMALGARAEQVKAMMLRQGLILSGIGVVIGLVLAIGLTRLMAGVLFGVSPLDPITFVVVAVGLTGVALTASYLPARRAARVDPMSALRAE
jgi:predicted permease